MGQRLKAAAGKAHKLKKVRKAGVSKTQMLNISRAAIASGPLYGAAVVGFADHQLVSLRRALHATLVPTVGSRSAIADLQMAATNSVKNDPSVRAAVEPAYIWAIAWREGWLPKAILKRTMTSAMSRRDTVSWKNARGPADVTLLSLHRADWRVHSCSSWVTPRGQTVDLDD